MRPTPPQKTVSKLWRVYSSTLFRSNQHTLDAIQLARIQGASRRANPYAPQDEMNIQDNRKRCYESSGSNDNNHTKERNPPGVNREFKTKRKEKNDDDFENRIPIRFGEIRADVVVRLSYTLAIDVRLQRLCNIKHEKRKKEKIHQLQMSYDNREGINKNKTKQSRLGTRR